MPLNKQRGNMYPWVTHTWNPLGGQCQHRCVYCYTKTGRLKGLGKYEGEPFFDQKMGKDNLYRDGKNTPFPYTIFVCSMTDLFGAFIPDELIHKTLSHCLRYPENTYLLQSKNPGRMIQFINHLPPNVILATTIETDRGYDWFRWSNAPEPEERWQAMMDLREHGEKRIMISIEPIMDFTELLIRWIQLLEPEFVSVGADSKKFSLPEPTRENVELLIGELQESIDVRVKPNLGRLTEVTGLERNNF